MPPSQLKKLKSSLREKGVVRQQKSKKQQRQALKDGTIKDTRSRASAVLQSIREEFNPFEAKPASRGKHDFSRMGRTKEMNDKSVVARPGTTKGVGEELRRKTLLVEMQRRTKVGGVLDRRFGESDVTITPEEKALQRFVAEKQRASKKGAIFDLEDDGEDENLTHLGLNLPFNSISNNEDTKEFDVDFLERQEDRSDRYDGLVKRRRLSGPNEIEDDDLDLAVNGVPERHKTKNEVMKEVISKSKHHKYERQQAKEDDDDLRAELDKDLPNLHALITGNTKIASKSTELSFLQDDCGSMDLDRVALLNGKDRSQADQEYDQRLRQMALDQRAKPSVATLTDTEKATQEAKRLQNLEQKRLDRMKAEPSNSDSEESVDPAHQLAEKSMPSFDEAEVSVFHLGSGLGSGVGHRELGVEDEDEFVMDDDFVGVGSGDELENAEGSNPSSSEPSADDASDNGDYAEYVKDLSFSKGGGRENLSADEADATTSSIRPKNNFVFQYPCPQTHDDFLEVTRQVAFDELPIVVQQIRSLYRPQLSAENKRKLGQFASILVDHISYVANTSIHPPLEVCEALIRHIHSLAKTYPDEIGGTFRDHLKSICQSRPTAPNAGDLMIFTAISSIFPTSDHFHQVVTPSLLCMTQYLGQKVPVTLRDLLTGAYIVTLCVEFQKLSKRYVPEAINYTLNTIITLLPARPEQLVELSPFHLRPEGLQLTATTMEQCRPGLPLDFGSIFSRKYAAPAKEEQTLIYGLLVTHLSLVVTMARLWAEEPAFCEMMDPIYTTLQHVAGKECSAFISENVRTQAQETADTVHRLLQAALQARLPLCLHNHRPLAIKTSMPKFEESYNPDKHYDPDRDRAELSKIKAEHRKERKGALRELRKDANFLAREKLREKKERDSAYEKRYKRLVAEIQGEEGREAKLYEKEKKMRKEKR